MMRFSLIISFLFIFSYAIGQIEYAYGPVSVPDIKSTNYVYEITQRTNAINFDQSSDLLFEVGYIYSKIKSYSNALLYFAKSMKVSNYQTQFYSHTLNYHFAHIYEQLSDFNKARYYYLLHDDKYLLYIFEGNVLKFQKRYEKAEEYYNKAQRLDLYEMKNIEPFYLLAKMFYECKYYKKALFYANKYLVLNKEDDIGYSTRDNKEYDEIQIIINKSKNK